MGFASDYCDYNVANHRRIYRTHIKREKAATAKWNAAAVTGVFIKSVEKGYFIGR